MKRLIVLFLVIGMACSCLFAVSESQYEYLVVSFGKTYFSELRSKTMAYWDQGISKSAKGATDFEKDLDILGQHGWEVVSILGAIGGDQQVTLKRAFDESRTSNELKLIDENSDKVIDGLLDSLAVEDEKTKQEEAGVEITLVELDAYEAEQAKYEAEQAKLNTQSELETTATNFLNRLTINPKNISYEWEIDPYSKKDKMNIGLNFDVTKDCLININQYRQSEVEQLLNSYGEHIKAIPIPKDSLTSINLDGYITYMDKEFFVGNIFYYIDYYGNWERL